MTGNRKVLAATATAYISAEFERAKLAKRVSVRALATEAHLGSSTVQRALKGSSDLPVEAYLMMCSALGINPVDLMKRAEEHASAAHGDKLG
ncbi:hypothetical protein ATK74_1807 [Propionicimonas paludicola]|uniref:Cro/C1-type helix-turn-helix DNA-binding protein n=1 Tax=Propionicimonas paludicola TaxID=185243 RepID=A0A2A9CS36_9ACTN|nr:hypothetical protein [Propionicimonas paludicola]PFG17244.1 hypothetical protein ATK74_1807 [Propionicimonas paludicola]